LDEKMKHEFNVKKFKDATVYTLESATSGGTSAGSVASISSPMGGVRRRGDNLVAQEEKKEAPKPRNFVAKNAKMGGAGQHKDKKKEQKQGNEKHKKPYMEDHEVSMASNELKSIHSDAQKLLVLVQRYGENGDLQAWQQSKITKAADYLNSVLQSISGEQGVAEFAPAGGGSGNTPRGPKTPGNDPWGGDDSGEDPYSRPEPEYYSRSIDFFGQFEADHFDQEDMDDETGVFKGYWDYDGKMKQIAYFKFDDPEQTGSDDPGMGWYYEPENESVAEGNRPFRGVGGAFDRGDDERHDLDPTDWYFVKDGKMFAVSIYPNQEQEAMSRGYSRTRDEAKAKASEQGATESDAYMESLAAKLAEKIPANAPVDVWVKDFQKADPNKYHQFKNKTPKKKAQMAAAASYAAKNPDKK
jgi:hypothetical protein